MGHGMEAETGQCKHSLGFPNCQPMNTETKNFIHYVCDTNFAIISNFCSKSFFSQKFSNFHLIFCKI